MIERCYPARQHRQLRNSPVFPRKDDCTGSAFLSSAAVLYVDNCKTGSQASRYTQRNLWKTYLLSESRAEDRPLVIALGVRRTEHQNHRPGRTFSPCISHCDCACASRQKQYVFQVDSKQFDGELCPCLAVGRGILTSSGGCMPCSFSLRVELGNDRRTGIATTEALRDKQSEGNRWMKSRFRRNSNFESSTLPEDILVN